MERASDIKTQNYDKRIIPEQATRDKWVAFFE